MVTASFIFFYFIFFLSALFLKDKLYVVSITRWLPTRKFKRCTKIYEYIFGNSNLFVLLLLLLVIDIINYYSFLMMILMT